MYNIILLCRTCLCVQPLNVDHQRGNWSGEPLLKCRCAASATLLPPRESMSMCSLEDWPMEMWGQLDSRVILYYNIMSLGKMSFTVSQVEGLGDWVDTDHEISRNHHVWLWINDCYNITYWSYLCVLLLIIYMYVYCRRWSSWDLSTLRELYDNPPIPVLR